METEASRVSKFFVPHAVKPYAMVVRRTLYMGGDESSVLQCFDCAFAFLLCHSSIDLLVDLKVLWCGLAVEDEQVCSVAHY